MKQRNILITSAGKRVELLLEFKTELKRFHPDALVIAVDLNPKMAPACHLADKSFQVPKVNSKEYVNALLEICRTNEVGLIIPTIDTELLILSKNINVFQAYGIHIMVSDYDFINICRDKRKTVLFFNEVGIRNPEPRHPKDGIFPIFAKPYDGSLSTNIHILRSVEDLTKNILEDPKLMFMEYIDKSEYKEFTVDLYYGKDSCVKSIVPRERIEIRSGEVNKGAARKNYIVRYLKDHMGYIQGVRGCICVQLFYREKDNDVIGIEINPRFGGGYPLSYYAGANFPALMIREYMDSENVEYSDNWQDNTYMLRYDSQVIFHG